MVDRTASLRGRGGEQATRSSFVCLPFTPPPRALAYVLSSPETAFTEIINSVFVVESNGQYSFLPVYECSVASGAVDPFPAPFPVTPTRFTIFSFPPVFWLFPSSLCCELTIPLVWISSYFSLLLFHVRFFSLFLHFFPLFPHIFHLILCPAFWIVADSVLHKQMLR